MNTKFSFALLVVLVVLIVTACAPAITDKSAPIAIAVPPADNQTSALVPVSGGSAEVTARSDAPAPRLWSGEVFLSDNDAPDRGTNANLQDVCMSEDSLPHRHGGCVQ